MKPIIITLVKVLTIKTNKSNKCFLFAAPIFFSFRRLFLFAQFYREYRRVHWLMDEAENMECTEQNLKMLSLTMRITRYISHARALSLHLFLVPLFSSSLQAWKVKAAGGGSKFAGYAAALRVISCRQKASNSAGKMHYGNLHNPRLNVSASVISRYTVRWPRLRAIVSCGPANSRIRNRRETRRTRKFAHAGELRTLNQRIRAIVALANEVGREDKVKRSTSTSRTYKYRMYAKRTYTKRGRKFCRVTARSRVIWHSNTVKSSVEISPRMMPVRYAVARFRARELSIEQTCTRAFVDVHIVETDLLLHRGRIEICCGLRLQHN